MDTVLFSMFYPSEPGTTKERVVWFPKLEQTIDGFLRMAKRTPNCWYRMVAYPLAGAAIYGTTFPAQPNVPLRNPPASEDPSNPKKKWPLMIFSHGVGCSRLMYSAFCGEMASRGYIVCAIEHRDGTSPSSTIVTEDGRSKTLDWLEWTDLDWPELETQPADDTTLRHEQIKMRVAEIDEVIKAMKRLSNGENITRTSINLPDFDWSRWQAVDVHKPIMAGHSLGGSAGLAAGADNRFDFGSIVAMDPAIQRLEPWSSSIPAPLFVVNSEEFTRSPDFLRLTNLAKYASSSVIFSIAGATHPSFSDVFLILPGYINRLTGLTAEANVVMDLCVRAVMNCLNGDVQLAKDRAQKVIGPGEKVKEGTFLLHETQ